MLEQLQKHIHQNFSFLKSKKLLLAISGGIDSMVLLDLFWKLDYAITVAHCNFQLRGTESDEDAAFLADYCQNNHIPLISKKMDTLAFADNHKISIQQAARELRYEWFYNILETNQLDYILTAHHLDDSVETFFIHLSRGTGLEGLCGIPAINDKIVRPLLLFSRAEIEKYAKENAISWREDSSNASDKYLRNKIRQQLVPILKEINPSFLNSFQNTQNYLQNAQELVDDASTLVFKEIVTQKGDILCIDITKLVALKNYSSYLYQWLKNYGFSAWEDIYALVFAQAGKFVLGKTHRILKDRTQLIIAPLSDSTEEKYWVTATDKEINYPINLSFCNLGYISEPSQWIIFVDKEKLKFPLIIRKWEEGDYFYPSGMQGKKKVSKYFKDEKFSLIDKEKTWLLCSGEDIIWIIGHRSDQRFLATQNTQHIVKIEVQK